jgi:hypothetical protein
VDGLFKYFTTNHIWEALAEKGLKCIPNHHKAICATEAQRFCSYIFTVSSVRVTTFNAHVWDMHKHTRLIRNRGTYCSVIFN